MVVDGKTIQVLLPVGAYLIWKLVSLRIDLDDECNGIRCWDHIHSRNTWGARAQACLYLVYGPWS